MDAKNSSETSINVQLTTPLISRDILYSWLHYNVNIFCRFGKDEYLLADILHGAISGLTAEGDIKDVSIKSLSEK
jgi:hypothetical protein